MKDELEKIQVLLEEAKNSFNEKHPNIDTEEMPTEMYCVINALAKVKNLSLSGVSHRRELLINFMEFLNNENALNNGNTYLVKDFLSIN